MKGLVFTEFLEMVEDKFGMEMVNRIIENSELSSEGVYTSVGTYDHTEMVQLIGQLSQETNIDPEKLLLSYGEYFFNILTASYPKFFENMSGSFAFLSTIENHIHVEVLKLYPDAQLPRFEIEQTKEDELRMVYHSERKMSAFARGLMNSCVHYFEEEVSIEQNSIKEDGSVVEFVLKKS